MLNADCVDEKCCLGCVVLRKAVFTPALPPAPTPDRPEWKACVSALKPKHYIERDAQITPQPIIPGIKHRYGIREGGSTGQASLNGLTVVIFVKWGCETVEGLALTIGPVRGDGG